MLYKLIKSVHQSFRLTDQIGLDLRVEMFAEELKPLVGEEEFDWSEFRHSTLIFDEAKAFAEQRSLQNSDRFLRRCRFQSCVKPGNKNIFSIVLILTLSNKVFNPIYLGNGSEP